MADQSIPLILCMESVNGEEVAITVEPDDDFQKFLDNARSLLGYDIDLNSITKDQPVSLTDNAYQYLLNAENSLANDQLLAEGMGKNDDDFVYILDDGTQINASQIHFDNEDPLIDLTAEKIPFVKYVDDGIDYDVVAQVDEVTKKIDIVESPVSRCSSSSSPKRSFANSLPFRLVGSGGSGFEAHYVKYIDNVSYSNRNPVPRTATEDSLNQTVRKDDGTFTREDILNMFKDPPAAATNNNTSFTEKRRHVRKTDPSRPGQRNWHTKPISYIDVDGTIIAQSENQDCFVCGTYVDNNSEKLYLFDNEDQRLHRSSPQKRLSTQLKIICEPCLNENFKPCRLKSPNQSLNPDEYLVIRKNQQYIFQKTKNFNAQNCLLEAKAIIDKVESKLKGPKDMEFVKVEIGSDGEIVTKSIDNDSGSDVVIVQDEKKRDRSSDVEIVEDDIDDSIIDNLDDADEQVKEFLGKYQNNENNEVELKCRFCEQVFEDLSQVIDHGEIHKHETDDDKVYPCPLCDYGYSNFKWLKGHLRAAHDKVKDTKDVDKQDELVTKESPIAKRTRSCNKKDEDCKETTNVDSENKENTLPLNLIIKTEVKQECMDESDEDGIWIVQTAEDEPTHNLPEENNGRTSEYKKVEKCSNCSQIIIARDTPDSHKCRKRNKKRKPSVKESKSTPTSDDLRRKIKKRKRLETSSDPLIVTCDDCNESFTSKVRLKFHMQFHDRTSMRDEDGRYRCCECKETTFESETQLFDHVHFQHQKQRMWRCEVDRCGKSFYLRATLTKHSRTHTDTRRYVCVSCGKRFLDKQTLDEHGVTHLQTKPFQCHICMKQLTRRSRLRMHVRAHDTPPTAALLLACALCRRVFVDRAQAEEHALKSKCIETFAEELKVESDEPSVQLSPTSGVVRRAAPVQAIGRGDRIVNGDRAMPLLSELTPAAASIMRVVEIEIAYRCEYCEDVFYSEDGLNNHRQIHKGVKNPFTCHICKVSFATYSRCTTHKTTHGFYKRSLEDAKKLAGKSPDEGSNIAKGILGYGGFPVVKHFLCEDCGRSYLHWTYLQVHRRMKHNNEKVTHRCNTCDLTFPNSWSLAYHKRKIHVNTTQAEVCTTAKPNKGDHRIPCRDCEELLPNKTALYKHRKKEHSDLSLMINNDKTDESWNPIGINMQGTINSQTPQKEDIDSSSCAADAFRNNNDFHRTKTYTCSQCGDVFRTACTLSTHMRSHAIERIRTCDCGMDYTRTSRQIGSSCPRCSGVKRYGVRTPFAGRSRHRQVTSLYVIEVDGLNPSKDSIKKYLDANNIQHDKVLDINTISYSKGATGIVPDCVHSLSLLSHVPRVEIPWSRPDNMDIAAEEFVPALATSAPRRPKILQRAGNNYTDGTVQLDTNAEELSELNLQMLLDERVLVNGNRMVRLESEDDVSNDNDVYNQSCMNN